jgi:hypothetical protein
MRIPNATVLVVLGALFQGVPRALGTITPVSDQCRVLLRIRDAFAGSAVEAKARIERREADWRITSLTLSGEDLQDSDLSRVSRLISLDSVRLESRSQVPTRGIRALAALPRLRRLGLSGPLTEGLIEAVCDLNRLEDLNLAGVAGENGEGGIDERGLVRLRTMRGLRRLSLTGVALTDWSLDHILPEGALEELDLGYSDFVTHAGLANLKRLKDLRAVRITVVDEAGLRALKDLPHLDRLAFGEYGSSARRADLSVIKGVRWLSIYGISGFANGDGENVPLPENLERLEVSIQTARMLNLKSSRHIADLRLDLGPALIRDGKRVDLGWLNSLPELRELTLIAPIDSDMNSIAGLTSLSALTLRISCMGGIGNEGARAAARLARLESLTIDGGGEVTEEGIRAVCKLPELRRLELSGFPRVTDGRLTVLRDLGRLRSLKLALSCDFHRGATSPVFRNLKTLGELEELSLGGRLTDEDLDGLTTLRNLRELDLTRAIGFTDRGLALLMAALPNLRVVEFSVRRARVADQGKK